jgi:hypothetical protein
MTDDTFTLANDKQAPKPRQFENNDKARQTVMFGGLDCLPGQLDLFQTDGRDDDETINKGEQSDDNAIQNREGDV